MSESFQSCKFATPMGVQIHCLLNSAQKELVRSQRENNVQLVTQPKVQSKWTREIYYGFSETHTTAQPVDGIFGKVELYIYGNPQNTTFSK